MIVSPNTTQTLQTGEYLLSDPTILDDMRLSCDIQIPGSQAILVAKYTLITPYLIQHLQRRNIETLFAEPIPEKTVLATVEHVHKMFGILETILENTENEDHDAQDFLKNRREMILLKRLIKNNLSEITQLFKTNPTEKLIALTQHHNGTARHSIIAAFNLMALGQELGWSDIKIVKAAIAALNHDIGKIRVTLDTLNWPRRLSHDQWAEVQQHTLFGGHLLHQTGNKPDVIMLTALLHHEWYANVDGKGYGGLTLFSDSIRRSLDLDIPKIISEMDQEDLEIIQACALADMVSALEEVRAYKRGLDSFKVLIIMNTDARMGHFNPEQFAAWHRIYTRQNPKLLPLGRRMALPREKEHRIFTPLSPQVIRPTRLLTYHELEQLGFLTVLQNVGTDMERIQRRGGLALSVLEQINREKGLNLDYSASVLRSHNINLVKTQLLPETQLIELDTWREWLTIEELKKSRLLHKVKAHHFDLDLIQRDGGISPTRLRKRGLLISPEKLKKMDIEIFKKWPTKLPGSENRLTLEDLGKLSITEQRLKQAGCLDRVRKSKNGVPLEWLAQHGFILSSTALEHAGIDPIRKIFYDIQVVEEINETKAKFLILREEDDPKELEALNVTNDLEPIQNLLFNQIGEVVMEFADLIALPDLSNIPMGSQWGIHAA